MTDAETISNLQAENASQFQKIESLEEKVELLLELLQKKVVQKDFHNSSLPPSSDLFTKNKASVLLVPVPMEVSLDTKVQHWK